MFYRDYMQKFRPAYAPDGAGDGAAPAAGATPAAAPAASDAAAAPAAPDASAAAAPSSSEAPAAPAAPAATEAAAATPESTPSLIEQASGKPKKDGEAAPASEAAPTDPKKDEPAPAAADKTDAEKAAEAAAAKPKTEAELKAEAEKAAATDPATKDATAIEPPAPIKYEAFKVPEGLKLDDERIGKFTEIAGPAQVPQEIAQKLLDLHVEEIERVGKEAIEAAVANQRKSWNTYVDTITTELRKDPELGGNRLETSLSMAKAVIEEYLPAQEAAEYLGLLRHNGMGNHRLQVKLLHEIGRVLNIFEDGMVPANPQAPKPAKGPGNRGWYNNTPGNAAS